MSQSRYACRGCSRIVAQRRHGKIAPTASGRILAVAEGRALVACLHCGARLWVPPKDVLR